MGRPDLQSLPALLDRLGEVEARRDLLKKRADEIEADLTRARHLWLDLSMSHDAAREDIWHAEQIRLTLLAQFEQLVTS